MKGWRTIIFNVVSFAVTFGGVALQHIGALGLTPAQSAAAMMAVNAIVIAGNIWLRTVTDTPVGRAAPLPEPGYGDGQ